MRTVRVNISLPADLVGRLRRTELVWSPIAADALARALTGTSTEVEIQRLKKRVAELESKLKLIREMAT